MALEHAILVSLAEQSATGYELARRFDASIGHFWTASHQQIYRVLGRMESDGWVTADSEAQAGKPDKKTYAITAAGHGELAAWSAEPSPHEVIRSDFTVKLRGLADPAALATDTRRRREEHVARLARFENSQARHYPDPSVLQGRDLGAYLALRGGISQENHGIAWCDEILAALAPSTTSSTTPSDPVPQEQS